MAFQLTDFQLFDNNGEPLNGGLVYVYEPGTTTEKDSYPTADDADAGTNANANPVELDSAGRGQVWGKSGEAYKLVIQTSAGVTLETVDDIESNLTNPLKVYTAAGTADAVTVSLDPNPGAWSTDVSFYFRPSATNTGSATININGLGAKTLKLPDASTNLPAGYLQTSNVYGVWYDGTNAVIVSAPDVIESGNNSNGYYVRYKDGTQECWHIKTGVSIGTGVGSVFFGVTSWTFPKAFSSTTGLVVTTGAGIATGETWGGKYGSLSASAVTDLRLFGASNSLTGELTTYASGRWY